MLCGCLQAAQFAAESAGAAVLKEQVFPLFESAGRLHLALKGEPGYHMGEATGTVPLASSQV
jgi:hypothetical protein